MSLDGRVKVKHHARERDAVRGTCSRSHHGQAIDEPVARCSARSADRSLEFADDMVATHRAIEALHGSTRRGGGCYLGTGDGGWVFSGALRSTLVLGPTRSGKTTSLLIPNVVGAPGAVVATSTKLDLLDPTRSARALVGEVMVFDPSGTVALPRGVRRIGWSPLDGAAAWSEATVIAAGMVGASRGGAEASRQDHWHERAEALLATLLHAAGTGERSMHDLVEWVDRRVGDEALSHLERDGSPRAAALLDGILATEAREQSGIWSTTSGILQAYRTEPALASTSGPRLDARHFAASQDSLYLCAPGRQQAMFAPLLVGLLGSVRDGTYQRASEGGGFDPVLLALDELANIAPLPDLPQIVSEGAGQGLLTLACLQDLSQARRRWGPEADAFLSLFPVTVVLPGIADLRTLQAMSSLIGDRAISLPQASRGRTRWTTTTSHSTSTGFRPHRDVAQLSRGAAGRALVLGPTKAATEVTLTPSFRDPHWRALLTPEDRHRER